MFQFLVHGGLTFTLPLTALAVVIMLLALRKGIELFVDADKDPDALKRGIQTILQVGGFCFGFGLLGLAVSLLQMFDAIEAAGTVPTAMLAGGLKVAMIVPIYGLLIFLGAAVLWFVLKQRYETLVAGA
jgi:hypothetical protein